MGQWTIFIRGAGSHHNFKKNVEGKLIPDGEGDYERTTADADHMAATSSGDTQKRPMRDS
jgi:hypothetical protein